MADYKNVVLFAQQLPQDKQAEGLAINWAVLSGTCNKCGYFRICYIDPDFLFPKDSFCMKKKAEILKEWGINDGKEKA